MGNDVTFCSVISKSQDGESFIVLADSEAEALPKCGVTSSTHYVLTHVLNDLLALVGGVSNSLRLDKP